MNGHYELPAREVAEAEAKHRAWRIDRMNERMATGELEVEIALDGEVTMVEHARGWWNMACWNGLSEDQQRHLILLGYLPFGYKPEGECPNGASIAIETEHDKAPGPRFYCLGCALIRLEELKWR